MSASSGKRRSFYTDLEYLRKCFDNVDQAKSGFIGYSELTKLVESMPTTGDAVVSELMEKLDRDKDGKVSFDDFEWLFEMEGDTASKKQKLSLPAATDHQEHYTGEVVLRRNTRRMTMPARLQRHRDLPLLSPIQVEGSPAAKRPPSSDLTDLASQMKYLTDANESPQLKRSSKVLSWIESGDMMFEDTGTGLRREEDLPSPPLSPSHGSDEASHVGSILESVCNTKDISKAAIAKLCEHAKADAQEQQELLALLCHLDKENKGFVSVVEFAQGLQDIKNSAAVGTSTPTYQIPFRKGFREMTPPRLSEPFTTPTIQGSKPVPLSSTPMVPSSTQLSSSILAAIDPSQSGFVKIDDIVNYWQKIGIETPHEQSLENVLTETLPVDTSGRVSVGELAATLEGSMVAEGKSQSVLRQVALKTFKNEIATLRTQVHQVSMERDKLKGTLNRTTEEKQKLIAEGDEHVDMIARKSEKEKREQEQKYIERMKELEKLKQQEALQLQERASNAIKDLESKMKELKGEEEKLREDLKYAQDDVNDLSQQLLLVQKELGKKDRTIAVLQRDLGNRSEHDLIGDETQLHHLEKLENELSERNVFVSELQDKLRATQDNCDELKAENERMKQKNLAQKRAMQKSHSLPNTSRNLVMSSKKRLNRPLSGSHFRRRSMPLHPRIPTSVDLDLAVQRKNHPILIEETEDGEEEVDFMLPHLPPLPDSEEKSSESEPDVHEENSSESEESTDMEEDDFAKSTTSLMEEFRQERLATLERKQTIDRLDVERKKHDEIVTQLKQEIFRLEEFSESQQEQALKLEEDKSQIIDSLKELRYELESERKSHEVEVNILTCKIENAENDVLKLEASLKQLQEERALLQRDYEAQLMSVEKAADLEKAALQEELGSNISEKTDLQSELLQMKEHLRHQKQTSLDTIVKLESQHSQQSEALKSKHIAVLEALHKELNTVEQREKSVKDKLDRRNRELKSIMSQLQDLHERETAFKKQISAFEANEINYQCEVKELQNDVTKLQGEVSHLKSAAIAYKNKISSLKAELQNDPQLDSFLSLQSSSRRSSTSPESSRHSEIITKMKVQLGELQKVLESKSASVQEDGERQTAGIELINSLITNSSALDADVQRMRRGFSAERLAHKQVCSQKDQALQNLQAEKERQSSLVKAIAMQVSQDITSNISALEENCGQSISECEVKLESALLKLASIGQSLKNRYSRHVSAVDSLLSDLDQSHSELSNFRDEISRLELELEKSCHNFEKLKESRDNLSKLHKEKDAEMDELKARLDQVLYREIAVDRVSGNVVSSRNVKVDEDSGQVIAEQDDDHTRDEALLEKDETIQALMNEIEQLKHADIQTKHINEEVNRRLLEREREMVETRQVMESLQIRTKELESKLEQQTHAQKEIVSMQTSLQLAREEMKTNKRLLELQHKQAMKEMEDKYISELTSAREVIAKNILEARDFYAYLMDPNERTEYSVELEHSEIMSEAQKEVYKLREQFAHQQIMYNDLEATLTDKIEEHEHLEAQFTAEHEEEVRALRQQKQHLMKQLEDAKEHYENILDNQEQQSMIMVQELMNRRTDLEKELKGKTEETFHVYQQVADLSEEKKVLVDVIKQLCIVTGRQVNVV